MMDTKELIGGGVILAVLAVFWEKIVLIFWYFAEFFICRYTQEDIESVEFSIIEGMQLYIWKNLNNKRALSPIYSYLQVGSGEDFKIFIKETGFKNLRLIFFGKVPALVKLNINNNNFSVYGLKPLITEEKILHYVLNYYEKYKKNKSNNKNNNFYYRYFVSYIRGSLNKFNNNDNFNETTSETPSSICCLEKTEELDIGIRINYTKSEYKKMITLNLKDGNLIDDLYLTENMKDIKNKIEKWLLHKNWFLERGIQWKRGILLYGEPGTGKTSFINALAEYFGLPLFIFDLATFTNEDMEHEWDKNKYKTPCIALFEDFDSIFEGRKNVYTKNQSLMAKPISFDCILNILDGAKKYDGILTIITTNNIKQIDSALGGLNTTRPGRIDYVFEMNGIGYDGKEFIAEKILGGMKNYEEMKKEVMQKCDKLTPAQFKERCINKALTSFND